jgi:hypothetical protein
MKCIHECFEAPANFIRLRLNTPQLNSRLEAAPTESLSNGNLDFPDKQVIFFS